MHMNSNFILFRTKMIEASFQNLNVQQRQDYNIGGVFYEEKHCFSLHLS